MYKNLISLALLMAAAYAEPLRLFNQQNAALYSEAEKPLDIVKIDSTLMKTRTGFESFRVQSEATTWERDANQIPCIVGFVIFGCFYFFTIFYVFVDINRRLATHKEDVADALRQLKELGMDERNGQWPALQQELQNKLKGVVATEGQDSQLMGGAIEVTQAEWEKCA